MPFTLQIKRVALDANIPTAALGLEIGELVVSLDENKLYLGDGPGNPPVPIVASIDPADLPSTLAGAGLTLSAGVFNVGAGNGITVGADTVSLASSVAGNGLAYASGVLSINVDSDVLQIVADALTIASGLAGTGLVYGSDPSRIYVDSSYIRGLLSGGDGITYNSTIGQVSVDLATISGLEFSTGKLAILTDDSTLELDAIDSWIQVKAAGITATHLNTSVAGNGLTGGGGSALAINLATNPGLQIVTDQLSVLTDPNGGLEVGALGVKLAAGVDGDGIAETLGVLSVALAANSGLEFSSGLLRVDLAASSALSLTGGLAVQVQSTGGIIIDANELAIAYTLGNAANGTSFYADGDGFGLTAIDCGVLT